MVPHQFYNRNQKYLDLVVAHMIAVYMSLEFIEYLETRCIICGREFSNQTNEGNRNLVFNLVETGLISVSISAQYTYRLNDEFVFLEFISFRHHVSSSY